MPPDDEIPLELIDPLEEATPAVPVEFDWRPFLAQSSIAYLLMWLGTTLAGGVFGTCLFPLVGTIIGLMLAGMVGWATSLLGVLLHLAMRGRLPLRTSSSFAGATAGIVSWGVLGYSQKGGIALPPELSIFLLITAFLGSLGSALATSLLLRAVRRPEISKPLGRGQFTLADVMLFTAWVAVVMTAFRITVAGPTAGRFGFLSFFFLIGASMAATEGCYRLAGITRKRKPATPAG